MLTLVHNHDRPYRLIELKEGRERFFFVFPIMVSCITMIGSMYTSMYPLSGAIHISSILPVKKIRVVGEGEKSLSVEIL